MANSTQQPVRAFINRAQTTCLEFYASGSFGHLLGSESESEFKDALQNCGDGLLRFLVVELSANEDCEDIEDAIGRVSRAIEDLEAVHRNLNALVPMNEAPRG